MLVDGAAIGGQVEEVGRISAGYALNVTQLRAKRQMTASSFAFLTVPMHATMSFILMFILEIIRNFSTEIERVKTEIAQRDVELPSRLDLPSNVSEGGLGIFGVSPDDMTMVTWIMIFVIFPAYRRQLPGAQVRCRRQPLQDHPLAEHSDGYLRPGHAIRTLHYCPALYKPRTLGGDPMRWIKKLSKQSQEPESQAPEEETTRTQDNAPSDETTGAQSGSQATGSTPVEAESPDAVVRRLNLGEGSAEILPQRSPTEVFDTDEQLDLDLVQNVFTPMGAGQQQPAGEEPQIPPAEGPGSSSPNIIRRAVIQPEEEEETPTAPEAPQEETPRVRQRGAAEAPTTASEISADISTAPETPRERAPRVRQRRAAEAPTASEISADISTAPETPQEQTPRVRQRGAAEAPTAGTTPAEIPAAPLPSQEQAPGVRQTDAAARPEAPRVRQGETVASGQEAAPRARQRVSGPPGSEPPVGSAELAAQLLELTHKVHIQ